MHPDVWDVLEPSAIIALRKSNGKPRPIAMGDVFERVGRAMHPLQQARGSRQVVHVGRGPAPCAR
eukprot:4084035-Prymnesium_polylepis.1